MPAQDAWYFATPQGERIGPVTFQELRDRVQSGGMKRSDLVWAGHLTEWTPLEQIPEFAGWTRPPSSIPEPPPFPSQVDSRNSAPHVPGHAPESNPTPAPASISRTQDNDASMRLLLPVGRSVWAVAAGYLALGSLLPIIGILFGLAAVVTGIVAQRAIRRDSQLHGMGRVIFAYIVGGLGILGWGAMLINSLAHR